MHRFSSSCSCVFCVAHGDIMREEDRKFIDTLEEDLAERGWAEEDPWFSRLKKFWSRAI